MDKDMNKVIKETTGQADFTVVEVFDSEESATEGTSPIASEVKSLEIKIDNTKWRKEQNE
jgi:hypothetical protein